MKKTFALALALAGTPECRRVERRNSEQARWPAARSAPAARADRVGADPATAQERRHRRRPAQRRDGHADRQRLRQPRRPGAARSGAIDYNGNRVCTAFCRAKGGNMRKTFALARWRHGPARIELRAATRHQQQTAPPRQRDQRQRQRADQVGPYGRRRWRHCRNGILSAGTGARSATPCGAALPPPMCAVGLGPLGAAIVPRLVLGSPLIVMARSLVTGCCCGGVPGCSAGT